MRKTVMTMTIASVLVMGAVPAFAATDNSMSTSDAQALCTKLTTQFEFLAPFKKGLPYWQKADAAYKTGESDCHKDKPVLGARSLQAAISDMYVKPDSL
ncbi:MAG: hypothetical protein WA138_02645 [Parvibaculum sp.]